MKTRAELARQLIKNSRIKFAKNRFVNRLSVFKPVNLEFSEEDDQFMRISFTVGNTPTSVHVLEDRLIEIYGNRGDFFYYTDFNHMSGRHFFNVTYTLDKELFEGI